MVIPGWRWFRALWLCRRGHVKHWTWKTVDGIQVPNLHRCQKCGAGFDQYGRFVAWTR